VLRDGGWDQPVRLADRCKPSLLLELILEDEGVDDVPASNTPPRFETDAIIQQIVAMIFDQ
jgi:hypothetical protein